MMLVVHLLLLCRVSPCPLIRYVFWSEITTAHLSLKSHSPSFLYQSSRLNLGKVKYGILWSGRSVTVQFKLEMVIVSIVLEENANLGVMDEFVSLIQKTLLPFCSSLS